MIRKVLLDENLDHRLRRNLSPHDAFTTSHLGWDGLKNGRLLEPAEAHCFDVLLTGDQTLYFEQNLSGQHLAILVLSSVEWRIFKDRLSEIVAAIDNAGTGTFRALEQNQHCCTQRHR